MTNNQALRVHCILLIDNLQEALAHPDNKFGDVWLDAVKVAQLQTYIAHVKEALDADAGPDTPTCVSARHFVNGKGWVSGAFVDGEWVDD